MNSFVTNPSAFKCVIQQIDKIGEQNKELQQQQTNIANTVTQIQQTPSFKQQIYREGDIEATTLDDSYIVWSYNAVNVFYNDQMFIINGSAVIPAQTFSGTLSFVISIESPFPNKQVDRTKTFGTWAVASGDIGDLTKSGCVIARSVTDGKLWLYIKTNPTTFIASTVIAFNLSGGYME